MRSYSVPRSFIFFIGLGLIIISHLTVNNLLKDSNPTGTFLSIAWSLVLIFLWYKFFTTAYRLEITDDSLINIISLTCRTVISKEQIHKISEWGLFVNMTTDVGTFSVSSLMDGTGNIRDILQPMASKVKTAEDSDTLPSLVEIPDKQLNTCRVNLAAQNNSSNIHKSIGMVFKAEAFSWPQIFIVLCLLTLIDYDSFYSDASPADFFIIAGINWGTFLFIFLFGIRSIEVPDSKTIIIRRLIGTRFISPQDVRCVMDGMKGSTLVLTNRNIWLSQWIENLAGFKTLLASLNPNIKFIDSLNEATRSKLRICLIIIGVFAYLAVKAAVIFFLITSN